MSILKRIYKIARARLPRMSKETIDFSEPATETDSGIPQQVLEDLAVFNLTPPSSMTEVRKARNREIKKYHSDKFMSDQKKFETSKEIMQIVNAAYDRLKIYYEIT